MNSLNKLKIAKKIKDHLREVTNKLQELSHIMRMFLFILHRVRWEKGRRSWNCCGSRNLDQNMLYERKLFSVEENSKSILEEKHG